MKTSKDMIEEVKNDPAASYWLKEQVGLIGKRDLHDHICDVDHLEQILELFVDETFTDYDRWANEETNDKVIMPHKTAPPADCDIY